MDQDENEPRPVLVTKRMSLECVAISFTYLVLLSLFRPRQYGKMSIFISCFRSKLGILLLGGLGYDHNAVRKVPKVTKIGKKAQQPDRGSNT